MTGTEDVSGPTGLTLGFPVTATISINPDGTGTLGQGVVATNGSQAYFINQASGVPAQVQVFEH